MKHPFSYFSALLFILLGSFFHAQVGLEVTPPRNYFRTAPGERSTKKIIVSNSSKTAPFTLTVSFNDWKYDEDGNNIMAEPGTLPNSCSTWISIQPQSYFTLNPGESKEIDVTVTPPATKADTLNVHTAMLYITQTNPIDSYNADGALIKVSLRNGIKVYHQYSGAEKPEIEFTDFKMEPTTKMVVLSIQNKGNVWTDGPLTTELINQKDGSVYHLEDQIIYTLPGDQRRITIPLPQNLKAGKYIATSTFAYGDDETIKMAELTFDYD